MLRDTLLSQYASTHQIWNSYLKEYRRYALDRKCDGRTDRRTEEWTKQLLYASHSSFGGIKTVLLKKLSSLLPQTQCVYTIHHCIKPESPSDGRCFVILTSKWILRCSLKLNPQSVIRYQQFALWIKMSNSNNFAGYWVLSCFCYGVSHALHVLVNICVHESIFLRNTWTH